MQTDVEMRDWVAEHIDRSDPWGWFVGTASDFIQRTRNIKKENSSLGELSLGWLDTLLEENRGEAELSPAHIVPALFGLAELYRYTQVVVGDGLKRVAALNPQVARAVIDGVMEYHNPKEHPEGAPLNLISICDPYCGIGSLLAIPAVCGAVAVGLEAHEPTAAVARELLADMYVHPLSFEDVSFEGEDGVNLHYLVTALPNDPVVAAMLLTWIAATGRNMLQGTERECFGLASWFAVVLVPPGIEPPSDKTFVIQKHESAVLTGYGDCLMLGLRS